MGRFGWWWRLGRGGEVWGERVLNSASRLRRDEYLGVWVDELRRDLKA